MSKKIVTLFFMMQCVIESHAQFYTITYGNCTSASDVASKTHKEVCTSDSSLQVENSDIIRTTTGSVVLDSLDVSEIQDKIRDVVNEFSSVSLPLKHLHVTSPFGMRFHPINKVRKLHNGIDLAAKFDEVYAMLDGVVKAVGYNKASGNCVSFTQLEAEDHQHEGL